MDTFKSVLGILKDLGWLGAAIVAIVGGIWVGTTYLHSTRIAYQKSFDDKQLDVIFLAAETVGELVAAPTQEEWEKHKARFWELYWGRLILFESNAIAGAMVKLGAELDNVNFADRKKLSNLAYDVSDALRDFLNERNENGWRITMDTLLPTKKQQR